MPLDVLLDQSMEWDIEEDGVYRSSFQVEAQQCDNFPVHSVARLADNICFILTTAKCRRKCGRDAEEWFQQFGLGGSGGHIRMLSSRSRRKFK